jgi:hypothetical protein
MFNRHKDKTLQRKSGRRLLVIGGALIGLALLCGTLPVAAQDQQGQTPSSPSQTSSQAPSQTQDDGKPKQDVPDEAGGPTDNVGPYAIPKKKAEDPPPPPPPVTPKKLEDVPDYSLKVNVPLVNVDVLVTTKDGQFIPGLKKDNFRIMEDGVAAAGDPLQRVAGSDHGCAAGGVCLDELQFPERCSAWRRTRSRIH